MGRSAVPAVLSGWLERGDASEAVLLSTCNRTELYFSAADDRAAVESARRLLLDRVGDASAEPERALYVHRDRHAAEHLFRVTSGLDSMVPGEPQIQGQVKDAYQAARETVCAFGPVTGPVLNRLFQSAFSVGGRIRSETGIGTGAASVPSAAVELAKKIFGSLRGCRVLVLGAGDTSEVTLQCLRDEGVRAAVVANRTHARARELADAWGADAIRLEEAERVLHEVDIVIASTSAPHLVLTGERFRRALPHGPARPLCIIDIALPRDVDPDIGRLSNVFLYNVDDLTQIVDHNLDRRRAEIGRAEGIIAQGVDEFWSWYSGLEVVPTIRDLRRRAEALRRDETQRMLRRLRHLEPEDQEAIDVLTRSLLNKVLHSPTVRLREAVGNGRGTSVLDTVRYLFELDDAGGREAGTMNRDQTTTTTGTDE